MPSGYPWATGDALLAADLNAAIAAASSAVAAGGPFMPLDGLVVLPGGSIQAAINALPASGGMITLSPNTTYVVTTPISSAKNNVHVRASSWNTVIQRGPALAGIVMQLSGSGCLIDGMTFDGNGSVNTTGSTEVQISGANSRITNVQVINSAATVNVAATGVGCRVDHCTIAGRGVSLSTQRGYGIWAINHVQVFIEHNKITGTGIDAIGFDGPGSVADGNAISGCHCWSGSAGAQLAVYANLSTGAGITISNNTIDQGGATTAGGIECAGNNLTITGNTIINQYGGGLSVDAGGRGIVITGNQILNVGLDMSGTQDGIVINAGITDFVITGNRVGDDNATPNMRWCVVVQSGASDRYAIVGNLLGPCSGSSFAIADSGTGLVKVVSGNTGVDTLVPIAYTAAALGVPTAPVFQLLNSGTTTITSIATAYAGHGMIKVALPNAAFTFTAGNNINNSVTTVANVPLIMTCDQAGHWWLK